MKIVLTDSMTSTHLSGSLLTKNVPFDNLPFSSNPSFSGRETLLKELSEHLQPFSTSTNANRSLALWGTGGIGKTQIALEFAHQQLRAGMVKVVLWVASETEAEISRTFSDAARKLAADAFEDTNTPDQNRGIVWNCLDNCGEWKKG